GRAKVRIACERNAIPAEPLLVGDEAEGVSGEACHDVAGAGGGRPRTGRRAVSGASAKTLVRAPTGEESRRIETVVRDAGRRSFSGDRAIVLVQPPRRVIIDEQRAKERSVLGGTRVIAGDDRALFLAEVRGG